MPAPIVSSSTPSLKAVSSSSSTTSTTTAASAAPSSPSPAARSLAARLTDDLFLGAYLVAEGAHLAGTELEQRAGRATVRFVVEGEADALAALADAYTRGEARTNVLRFKSALAHLKDVMFARLREGRRLAEASAGAARDETRGDEPCRFRSRRSRP